MSRGTIEVDRQSHLTPVEAMNFPQRQSHESVDDRAVRLARPNFRRKKEKRQKLPAWITQQPGEIIANWEQSLQVKGEKSTHYLFDLDDTLFDTAAYWVEFFEKYRQWYCFQQTGERPPRPTSEEVFAAGGPNTFYKQELGEELFEQLAEQFRQNRGTNITPGLVSPVVPEVVTEYMAQSGQILGGLTARPDTFQVRNSTWTQLQRARFWQPEWPVLFRPVEFTLNQAFDWKARLLAQFRQVAPNDLLILTDDNLETAQNIIRWNEENPDQMPLVQVIYNGNLTKYRLNGSTPEWESHPGIFVLHDWQDMPKTLDRVQQWYASLSGSDLR